MFAPLFDFLQPHHRISPEEIGLISAQLHRKQVKEGEVLLREGQLAKELFFICEGVLKITTTSEKGNEVTQFFLKENQFCSILSSFNNDVPAHENIVAACDADLIVFPKDRLWQLYAEIPYLRQLIDSITQQALLGKIQLRNGYMGEDATMRYQKFLQLQPDIALRVSLTDVASYLGITRQSLSRIRKNVR